MTDPAWLHAVEKLDQINETDPETAHASADDVLLEVVPPEVLAAYERVARRCRWWAFA